MIIYFLIFQKLLLYKKNCMCEMMSVCNITDHNLFSILLSFLSIQYYIFFMYFLILFFKWILIQYTLEFFLLFIEL